MDDNQQFKIPSSPQLGSANQIPESSTESSGLTNSSHFSKAETVETGFNSPDIRAMTDDIHYDQAGYQRAITGESTPRYTKPKTIGQLVGEATQVLSNMEASKDWNEHLAFRQDIRMIIELGDNIDSWRDSVSQTGLDGEVT